MEERDGANFYHDVTPKVVPLETSRYATIRNYNLNVRLLIVMAGTSMPSFRFPSKLFFLNPVGVWQANS